MKANEALELASDLKDIVVDYIAFVEQKGLSEEFEEWYKNRPGATKE
ncbi:hypothetical protein [Cohnella silvisoli]|uniref:Uncharacterized protein n=1 Tax=Cohnella silvisoli TaxID=2873699 RepID=A0ABV1L378_9BACL|nr:hypothetical protein [Cohnella silvisoli]MCD9026019.1 hypothetical protein [Cohnella silvisoli]